jgi:ribosomal protein L23
MTCDECIFLPSEPIWKSKSEIEGELGQKSPILPDHEQTFQVFTPNAKNEIKHALSFITKVECKNCNRCILKAQESVFYKEKIIFEVIGTEELEVRKEATVSTQNQGIINGSTIVGVPLHFIGKTRERYNFHDEPQEIKDATLSLLIKLLSVDGFLTIAQASVVAKLALGRKLRKSTERNTKKQFKKKLRTLQYIVDYWEDLENL